ncbi:hypothetical protein JZO66_10095 [Enterococcus sp. DIV0242_7C1]|uniref:Secreted protein n=1 Tax=Candidatus Enterococcus dunnyi TaxID=1834192 RepID=A0A200J9S9_9ENTE|nr:MULTISPECIES: hypothetical protein [unclassified Enterococcus]MBO0470898.1 hypothetical protein [Enterococcus sp. DIV0242_7C1]OUZ33345.1 hypothetical protein A5889_002056 [Enterococcus sp. 9D6_DIV0238]
MKKSSLLLLGMVILGTFNFATTVEAIGRFDEDAMYSNEMRERHMWDQENKEQGKQRNTEGSHWERSERRNQMRQKAHRYSTHPCWSAE